MRRSVIPCVVAAVLAGACAEVVVLPVKKVDGKNLAVEGVFYALPRTAARLDLKVDKTTLTAAPYTHFAAIFAPGSTPVCSKVLPYGGRPEDGEERVCIPAKEGAAPTNTAFALQQGAKISTFGEPDPDKVFVVTFTDGGALDQTLSMTWNESGLLSAASSTVTNRTTDIVMSGIKLVAGVYAKGGFGADTVRTAIEEKKCPEPYGLSKSDGWVLPVLHAVGGDSATKLVASYCEIPLNDKEARINYYIDEPTSVTLLTLATKAYVVNVLPLINHREFYLGGASNAADPKPMIEKLDTLIAAQLEKLYLGTSATKSWDTGAIEIRALDEATPAKVLTVHAQKGVCLDIGLLAPDSKPLPDGFAAKDGDCGGGKSYYLRLSYHPSKAAQVSSVVGANVALSEDAKRGFRYYLPARMNAQLVEGQAEDGKSFGGGVISVAQLGRLVSLPARRRSKAITYDLGFIESTGALKTFKLGTTGGLDAGTVDALAAASGTVLDARNTKRTADEAEAKAAAAAQAAASDEVNQLTRQAALLKLRDEICTLQRKYGLECTFQP